MFQQSKLTCQSINHGNQEVIGLCLNQNCNESEREFCYKCQMNTTKHNTCKEYLKSYSEIQNQVQQFLGFLLNKEQELICCFQNFNSKYNEIIRDLKLSISTQLIDNQYQGAKIDLAIIQEWHLYHNFNWQTLKEQINPQKIENQESQNSSELQLKMRKINEFIQKLSLINESKCKIEQEQKNYEKNLFQNVSLLNEQNWQKACDEFGKDIQELQKFLSLNTFFQGLSLIELNQPSKGIILRDEANQINTQFFDDLLHISNQILSKEPQNKFMLIAKSCVLMEQKNQAEAIKFCDLVLSQDPKHLHALCRKSYSLSDLGKLQQSLDCINEAIKINSNYVVALHQKGFCLMQMKKNLEAIEVYDQAIKLDSNYSFLYHNKGCTLQNMLRFEEALQLFDKAITLNSKFSFSYIAKGMILIQFKKYELAIVEFDKAILVNPTQSLQYQQKGFALVQLKQFKKALENYQSAIQNCIDDKEVFQKQIQLISNMFQIK